MPNHISGHDTVARGTAIRNREGQNHVRHEDEPDAPFYGISKNKYSGEESRELESGATFRADATHRLMENTDGKRQYGQILRKHVLKPRV